jgi:AcrR family transcriptional regulator
MNNVQNKTRWGDRPARRRDILRAARRLLERRGYAAFNVRDVARGAGVTAGTLYTYFEDKEALYAALYAERLDAFSAELQRASSAARSAEELFIEVATMWLPIYRLFGRELDVWALLGERRRSRRPLVEATLRLLAAVEPMLERFAPVRDRRLAVPLLWATLNGLCEQFAGARHKVHPYGWEELVRFASRTLVRGLTRKEPLS